jgi:hydroxymethylglutaryl-CoA lyase
VLDVAGQLLDLGCDEISVGDTIGVATPRGQAVLVPLLRHRPNGWRSIHDTRDGAANVLLALQHGSLSSMPPRAGWGCPSRRCSKHPPPKTCSTCCTEHETGVDLGQAVAASRYPRQAG